MGTLVKVGAAVVIGIAIVAGLAIVAGKTVSWVSGGVGYGPGVQAGGSLVTSGEWAIGLTALTVVTVLILVAYFRTRGPSWGGGL